MVDVHMIGSGLKPGEETGQAARGRKPVEGGEREGREAENASDQWPRSAHGAGLAEGQAGGKSLGPQARRQPKPTPTAPGVSRMSLESSTAACRCFTASR
jgi:hypothetical protein